MRSSGVIDLGIQPIMNLAPEPTPMAATSSEFGFVSAGLGSGNFSVAFNSTGGPANEAFMRATVTNAYTPTGGDLLLYGTNPNRTPGVTIGNACAVTPGKQYTCAMYVRSSAAQRVKAQAQFIKLNGGASGTVYAPTVTLVPNKWTRLVVTGTAGSDAQALRFDIDVQIDASTVAWIAGDTFDASRASIWEGAVDHGYYDGNSPGWNWVGAVGHSFSTGYKAPDIRQLEIAAGPIYSDATLGITATFSKLSENGPTGTPAYRIIKNAGVPVGWGAYIAAYLTDLSSFKIGRVPQGCSFVVSWYERSNYYSNRYYDVINGNAQQRVNTAPVYVVNPGDGQWYKQSASYTVSGDVLWRDKNLSSDPHTFRVGLANADNYYIDWSDVKVQIIG